MGQKVPSLSGNGSETLRDSADAKEWQDGVRHLLAEEVRSRAGKAMEENAGFLQTMHASIELFQNNPDLIPGARGFDKELADRFATLVTPYELRNEGKLQGYSIPVQPILDQLRTSLQAERAAKAPETPAPAAGATTPAPPQQAAQQPPAQPQAGITSKAGAESQEEGFAALWGTLGLPDIRL